MDMTKFVTALGPTDVDDGDIGRQQRGLAIAALANIRRDGFGFRVPSQSRDGSYFVSLEGQGQREPYCECPDWAKRRAPCKHVWAVKITVQRTEYVDGTTIETVQISRPWRLYNRAQESEGQLFEWLLRELCDTVPQPPQAMGRPRYPLPDMIYSMGLKVFSTYSARRAMSNIRRAAAEGRIAKAPSTSTPLRYFGRPEVTPVLEELIQVSSLPLCHIEREFAIDSTGFSSASYNRWHDHKHGGSKKKGVWTKLHAMVGVRTNIVTAAKADVAYSADAPRLPGFVDLTAQNFRLGAVSADMAYSTKRNLHAIVDAGGFPLIPFKARSTANQSDQLWAEMYHYFMANQDEFNRHYHKRSNVETTFFQIKSRFGDKVRSKTQTARINEVLLKTLCHNLTVLISAMYVIGVAPSFGGNEAGERSLALAW